MKLLKKMAVVGAVLLMVSAMTVTAFAASGRGENAGQGYGRGQAGTSVCSNSENCPTGGNCAGDGSCANRNGCTGNRATGNRATGQGRNSTRNAQNQACCGRTSAQ